MMSLRVGIFLTLLSIGCVAVVASAQEDITVRQKIGLDTTPPTVPTSTAATAVAFSQINFTWASSTDAGSVVAGYRVFRDNIEVAVTTDTFYIDTGLTELTGYSYNVTAFDIFGYESARSATTSATTPAVPEPPPRSAGEDFIELVPIELEIGEVVVETDAYSADISFLTSSFSISTLSYGVTPQYELGSLAVDTYKKRHRFTLENLEDGRRHYFQIAVRNQRGDVVLYEGSFVTTLVDDTVPPENVSDFVAYVAGEDVQLEWKNPATSDFDRVRLVANENFFPTDEADGYLLYEGRKEQFRHEFVARQFDRVYYTIFAMDDSDNVSSGAIASVAFVADQGQVITVIPDSVTVREIDPVPESREDTTVLFDNDLLDALSFADIEFLQDARIHKGYQGLVHLDPGTPFTIRLAYELLPERLKTITVTFVSPDNRSLSHSYLLRVNHDKTYYQATIAPLRERVAYPMQLSVIDFQTAVSKTITGTVSTVPKTEQTYAVPQRSMLDQVWFAFSAFWWAWLLILLLILYLFRRLIRG